MRRFWIRVVWVGFFLLGINSIGNLFAAQETSKAGSEQPSKAPTAIRAVSEEVLLDLVVRDRRGRAVRDLKPDQIEIFEDGARQQVTSFRLVEGTTLAAEAAGGAAQAETLRQINLVSLVFERLGDEGRKLARQAALEFIRAELRPNVFVAVFTNDQRLYVLQQFTRDRNRLEQAADLATAASSSQIAAQSGEIVRQLERASAEFEVANRAAAQAVNSDRPTSAAGAAAAQAKMAEVTLRTIRTADLLVREHEGRSSLYGLLSLVKEQRRLPGRKTIIYYSEGLRLTPALGQLFESTVSEANRSNVSIYSVDARGLVTTEVSGAAREVLKGAESASQGTVWPGQGLETSARTVVAGEEAFEADARANVQDTLADLSTSTGGFLTANTNEVGPAMRRIAEDIRSYYELTYRPPAREYDGKFHRISVKTTRSGVTLQTRSGYYALPPVAGSQVFPYEMPMLAALNSTPAAEAFDYRAAVLHFGYFSDGAQQDLVMELPVGNFTFIQHGAQNAWRAHFSVLALIKNAEGQPVLKFSQDYPLEGPAAKMEALKNGTIFLTWKFRLPPGRYTLETVALDAETQKAGLRRSVLIVPRPPQGLALSSLSVIRRVDRIPPDNENRDDPLRVESVKIIPNLGDPIRQGAAAVVPLYFVIYPSAESAEKPQATLKFYRGGRVIASSAVQLPPPDPTGRIAYLGTVPAESFEPGRYEVRALVRQGPAAAEEYTFFSVKP